MSEASFARELGPYVNSTISGIVSCGSISEIVEDERKMPIEFRCLLRIFT
jgi:hypothetical protein